MNRILLTLTFLFSCIACVFAQGELPEETKEYTFPALAECMKQEKWQYLNLEEIEKWLNEYEFDENSLESPVKFLTLSCYLKLIQSLA